MSYFISRCKVSVFLIFCKICMIFYTMDSCLRRNDEFRPKRGQQAPGSPPSEGLGESLVVRQPQGLPRSDELQIRQNEITANYPFVVSNASSHNLAGLRRLSNTRAMVVPVSPT